MTDTTEVTKQEAFNPYDASVGDNYYLNRAWQQGKDALVLFTADETEGVNPFNEEGDNASRHKAWHEGYVGTGYSADAFDHPIPTEDNGVFLMPDIATMPFNGVPVMSAVTVWCYDAQADKQDPKVRPMWSNFPSAKHSIRIADGHAWSASHRWIHTPAIRGTKTVELPCPPYTYEQEGIHLRITAGVYTKAGTKAEWEGVLAEMQAEVEDMPDGQYVGDDYVSATLTVTYQTNVSIPVGSLIGGDSEMEDGETWVGDEDSYHAAIEEALEGYDFEYDLDTGSMDYPDIDFIESDYSDLTSW